MNENVFNVNSLAAILNESYNEHVTLSVAKYGFRLSNYIIF